MRLMIGLFFFCYYVVRCGEPCHGSDEFAGLALKIVLYHNSIVLGMKLTSVVTCVIDESIVHLAPVSITIPVDDESLI